MQVKVEGLTELKKALTKKKVAVEKIASAVAKAGEKAEQVAKELVPKESGALYNSIQHKSLSGGKTIIIDAPAKTLKELNTLNTLNLELKRMALHNHL